MDQDNDESTTHLKTFKKQRDALTDTIKTIQECLDAKLAVPYLLSFPKRPGGVGKWSG
jgi:hypothetical protein